MSSRAADIWKQRVADNGCVMCRLLKNLETPAGLHHVREGQGLSQRAQDFLVVGLCHEHHQGGTGLHGLGTRGFYNCYRMDELDLLALSIEGVAKGMR